MSTTPIDTWAVDLADVTFIYPWVGSEVAMTVLAIVLWLVWHVWQGRHESNVYAENEKKFKGEELVKALRSERSSD